MVTAGFVLHTEREQAAAITLDLVRWMLERGHDVRLSPTDAARVALDEHAVAEEHFGDGLDVAISLGGDGTMLRTVEMVAEAGIPVIGINVGQLGYLTEVDPEHARMALKRFLSGAYEIEDRMLLSVQASRAELAEHIALNEAVIEKTPSGHTVRIDVSVDGQFFTTYAADGLIVATPTGSTAYSFSARGPIVAPMHRCIVLTPVSPHMLFDRTLVLDPHSTLHLEVVGHRPAAISADGRNLGILEPGDSLTCTASPRTARLVSFGEHDFLSILKRKFGLSDR